jgi:twinkle protein
MREDDSKFQFHAPCPNCGSSDANGVYDDGHQYCFSCQTYTHAGVPKKISKASSDLLSGEVVALPKRNLKEDTCRKFAYQVVKQGKEYVQIAPYYNKDGEMVAQKIRTPDKQFKILGDISTALPYGAQLWGKGKKIVVTEGEIDAMSVSQAQGNKWPVVSVPNGAQAAKKHMSKNFEFYDSYEEIILMFDQDEPGIKASRECAELFTPGKAKIAKLSMKDANELLVAGKEQEIIQAIWNAKP